VELYGSAMEHTIHDDEDDGDDADNASAFFVGPFPVKKSNPTAWRGRKGVRERSHLLHPTDTETARFGSVSTSNVASGPAIIS
jgi:hypothetical protein